jgi:hypothetical protein
MTTTAASRHCGEPVDVAPFRLLTGVLGWESDPGDAIRQLQGRYLEALLLDLERALAAAVHDDAGRGRALVAALGALPAEVLVAALCRPESARRLTTRLQTRADVTAYLERLAGAATEPDDPPEALLLGVVPVRFEPRGDPVLHEALARIERGLAQLAGLVPEAVDYVTRVMRELWLRRDPEKDGFFSNSPQGFIGRAVLTNPHLAMVDDVMLVEAVVHESTHGFVGMSEAVGLAGLDPAERWLLDDGPYDGASRVASAWTGKPLDIPTYLHACFVWWGLLQMWSRVVGSGAFEEPRVRSRMLRSATGFLDAALVEELRPHASLVQPALLDELGRLGHSVDAALRATGLDAGLSRGRRP